MTLHQESWSQGTVGQHIQSSERNRLSAKNIISSKTVFQKTNVNLRHSQINKNLKNPSLADAPYKKY